MKKTVTAVVALLMVGALVASTGCTRVRLSDRPEYRVSTERVSVPLGAATQLQAEIRVGVGELHLSSDASSTDALSGSITYGPATWKPRSSYTMSGSTGVLDIRQPEKVTSPLLRQVTNRWDLRLGGGVPTGLRLILGVGESTIDLRGADLTSLEVRSGVGDTTLDLSGPHAHSLRARVESGVGALTLRLPRGVGVRVTGRQDGLGDFDAEGFSQSGNAVQNEAYSGSGPKIDIDLTRGVGDVRLELVD